jgi:hypothetical protein
LKRQAAAEITRREEAKRAGARRWQEGWARTKPRAKVLHVKVKIDDEIIEID